MLGSKDCETCFWAREKYDYDMECLHPSVGGKVVQPSGGCARYIHCWDEDVGTEIGK